jgi:S-adenosylmethionine:tRNA ribosyltransferase-isomerase
VSPVKVALDGGGPGTGQVDRLCFTLPSTLRASAPPEERGVARDEVRMMVAYREPLRLEHRRFCELPDLLDSADLVVVNTSATLPAAVQGVAVGGTDNIVVHFSTQLSAPSSGDPELWVVEPRRGRPGATAPWAKQASRGAKTTTSGRRQAVPPPHRILLDDGTAQLELRAPYRHSLRLWTATVTAAGGPVTNWLAAHGQPIRYDYVAQAWPLRAYQNVYADVAGSAEMPSAGRPFTDRVLSRLRAGGTDVVPVVLHTGVSSLGAEELPYPERVLVPELTAQRANATRRNGGRVVAVGTTVVRALESAFNRGSGDVEAMDGWTELVVGPTTGTNVVDGILTGWHEPEASHLLMLEAIAGRPLLEDAYRASLQQGYLWHEFGDVALVLP